MNSSKTGIALGCGEKKNKRFLFEALDQITQTQKRDVILVKMYRVKKY